MPDTSALKMPDTSGESGLLTLTLTFDPSNSYPYPYPYPYP